MANAVLFDSDRPAERFPGELEVSGQGLVFRDQQGHDLELTFDGLQCRTGGIEVRTVYFSHPDHPGIEITSHDFEILEQSPLAELPVVQAAIKSSRGFRQRYWGGIGLLGCLMVGGALVFGGVILALIRFFLS